MSSKPPVSNNTGNDPLVLNSKGAIISNKQEATDQPLSAHRVDIETNEECKVNGQKLLTLLKNRHFKDALNILEHCPDCNIADEEDNGPVYLVLNGTQNNALAVELIQGLLDRGADPNPKNRSGLTPFYRLTNSNPAQVASLLLNAGADIEAPCNNECQTWLFRICSIYGRINDPADLQVYLSLGARLDAQDFRGCTILHDAVKSNHNIHTKLRCLIKMGLDPESVDYSGNTLFHEAVMSDHQDTETMQELCRLGLDLDQANHAGRTPVHLLCSIGQREPIHHEVRKKFFSWVLRKSKNIEAQDLKGITPLHLTSTVTQYYVNQLLKQGVEPTTPSVDGLTALHLAARARQSNIVGVIVDAMSLKDKSELFSCINARDESGRTALHYACRSGRPETVAILLEAGADPRITDKRSMTALDTCVEFEEECGLWLDYRRVNAEANYLSEVGRDDLIGSHLDAAGLTLEDESRPYVESGKLVNEYFGDHPSLSDIIRTEQETVRLDEILGILLARALELTEDVSWLSEAIDRSIMKAEQEGNIYTAACLRDLQIKMVVSKTSPRSSLTNKPGLSPGAESDGSNFYSKEVRNWITSRLPGWYDGETKQEFLARHGLCNLLRQSAATGTDPGSGDTLLHAACLSTLPNMDVVRMLVEELHVGVDAQNSNPEVDDSTEEEEQDLMTESFGDTPLHYLAKGHYWWQVAQGMPYLVTKAGANIEIENDDGQTPLSIALHSLGTFREQAARTLIDLGAKLHEGYLSAEEMVNYPDLLPLVLSTGVSITSSILYTALSSSSARPLEYLLSTGMDPNMRPSHVHQDTPSEHERGRPASSIPPEFYPDRSAWYPLTNAASNYCHGLNWKENVEIRSAKMIALLSHGANLYSIFRQPTKQFKDRQHLLYRFPGHVDEDYTDFEHSNTANYRFIDDEEQYPRNVPDEDNPPQSFGQRCVIHALLEDGDFVQPILELLLLELEHRDTQGRTLVLSACRSRLGADTAIDGMLWDIERELNQSEGFQYNPFSDPDAVTPLKNLLNRGADPFARDKWGKKALLQLLEAHDCITLFGRAPMIRRSLQYMANAFPELVNQPDIAGTYPLHVALQRMRRYEYVGMFNDQAEISTAVDDLLAAGADPNVRDPWGNTALHHLSIGLAELYRAEQHRRLFRTFLFLGLDINERNNGGQTAIFILLDDNGKRTKERESGQGLQFSDSSGGILDREVFDMFDDAGTDWKAKDSEGRTLLHIVARHNTPRSVGRFNLLLEKGVDLTIEDGEGRTALEVAKACVNNQILGLLGRREKQQDMKE